jgi:hypothetical protein
MNDNLTNDFRERIDGLIFADKQAHRKDFQSKPFNRFDGWFALPPAGNQYIGVPVPFSLVNAQHERNVWTIDVGIKDTDPGAMIF